MKFFKFLAMALVITFSLTFASFAESPAPQAKAKTVSFTTSVRSNLPTAVVNVNRGAVFDEIIVANYTQNQTANFPVAKFTTSFAGTKTIPNLSSQNRNVNFNNVKIESPPDKCRVINKTPERWFQPPNLIKRGIRKTNFSQIE